MKYRHLLNCVSCTMSFCPEEKFLSVPFYLRNGRFLLPREKVNVITVRIVFFCFKEDWKGCFASCEEVKEPHGWMGSSFIASNLAEAVAGGKSFLHWLVSRHCSWRMGLSSHWTVISCCSWQGQGYFFFFFKWKQPRP